VSEQWPFVIISLNFAFAVKGPALVILIFAGTNPPICGSAATSSAVPTSDPRQRARCWPKGEPGRHGHPPRGWLPLGLAACVGAKTCPEVRSDCSWRTNTPITARKSLNFVAVAPQTRLVLAKRRARQARPETAQRPDPGLRALRGTKRDPGWGAMVPGLQTPQSRPDKTLALWR
jgi:hypothetical protein